MDLIKPHSSPAPQFATAKLRASLLPVLLTAVALP